MRALLTTMFLLLSILPARADGELAGLITPFDQQRLARFDVTMKEALAEARAGGAPDDQVVLNEALKGSALDIAAYDLSGNWKCRVIKLGGLPPLTVYPNFKCRIADDGSGYTLTKLSGSQLTGGRFFTGSGTRLVYLGAGWVAGEKPRSYGDDPKENQVAYAERRGRNRIVLMFPQPQYESKLDVMVLER
jgi:hypothetical protein